jgi:hypothetical protein
MRTLESHFRLYLDNHLEKLLDDSFVPKSLFLTFRKDMKSLLEMLLYKIF